jgi:hypothetical protein
MSTRATDAKLRPDGRTLSAETLVHKRSYITLIYYQLFHRHFAEEKVTHLLPTFSRGWLFIQLVGNVPLYLELLCTNRPRHTLAKTCAWPVIARKNILAQSVTNQLNKQPTS